MREELSSINLIVNFAIHPVTIALTTNIANHAHKGNICRSYLLIRAMGIAK